VLGAGTVFIPCGVTQLMMAAAVSVGQPIIGAAMLGAYALGTSPLFFTLGFATAKLLTHRALLFIPALIIGYFGISSLNAGLTLADSPYTLKNFYEAIKQDTQGTANGAIAPRSVRWQTVGGHACFCNRVHDRLSGTPRWCPGEVDHYKQ
jgi:hypothetical protein